jgi:hypothetical protein
MILPPHRQQALRRRASDLRKIIRGERDPARLRRLMADLADTLAVLAPPTPAELFAERFGAGPARLPVA